MTYWNDQFSFIVGYFLLYFLLHLLQLPGDFMRAKISKFLAQYLRDLPSFLPKNKNCCISNCSLEESVWSNKLCYLCSCLGTQFLFLLLSCRLLFCRWNSYPTEISFFWTSFKETNLFPLDCRSNCKCFDLPQAALKEGSVICHPRF